MAIGKDRVEKLVIWANVKRVTWKSLEIPTASSTIRKLSFHSQVSIERTHALIVISLITRLGVAFPLKLLLKI